MSPMNLMAIILIEYDGTAKYIAEDASNVYGEMTVNTAINHKLDGIYQSLVCSLII
jgi:hypothetical protein